MAVVYVNDIEVDIGDEKLNLIQAAQKAGVFIPHYCWHPALSVVASCRMCLVEAGEKMLDGKINMQPRVVPACQTPAKHGTIIRTNTTKAVFAQQQTLEGLLLNHPLDCPVCDKAGECLLQDYSFRYGRSQSRMVDDKNTPPNKDYIGENITLFADRCIMCSRCVRFTREISGTAELQVINRGEHSEIDIFPGEPCDNKLAGNVVDLCPVGALCSKEFLYKQRVWFLNSTQSVCPDCSTGCSIHVEHNKNIVYRLRPRENKLAQGYFMCDEGRFDYAYINAKERLQQPLARRDGTLTATHYEELLPALRRELADLAKSDGAALAAVLSPFLTCEEAYLWATYFKSLSPNARLYLGHVPVVGEDDHYPKDRKGRAVEPVKFTIRAEKCPNRRGVEAVLRQFGGEVHGFADVLQAAGAGELHALYLTAGYPPRDEPWLAPEDAAKFSNIDLLIVQDLFPSPVSDKARYVLPAASFAEKDGTFVNHKGLAQAIHRAVQPLPGNRSEGQVAMDLQERRGLLHAATIRQEMAKAMPFFAPLASGELGELGVMLAQP